MVDDNPDSAGPAPAGGEADGPPAAPQAATRAVVDGLATHELTVLPMKQAESGLFVYHEASIDLVKELIADGIDAGYAHNATERTYLGERSTEILVAFIVNIASTAAWTAFVGILQGYKNTKKLSVTLVDHTGADGSNTRTATFDGTGAEVVNAMRAYLDNNQSPS